MFNYILRRIFYSILVIFGVTIATFLLFYVVSTPYSMARKNLGQKASDQAIHDWIQHRGYDRPVFFNTQAGHPFFDSQFFTYVKSLAVFDLGKSDRTGEPINAVFKRGAVPSLMIMIPAFVLGTILSVMISLFLVFVRESAIDLTGTFVCVILMSISAMAYIIFGQKLFAAELNYFPAFGFSMDAGFKVVRFVVLPIAIMVTMGLGSDVRLYRAIFLEESRNGYVRTAQAKGMSVERVLFVHIFKNGLISLITLLVSGIPTLILGSFLIEDFFGIPGLGNLSINAVHNLDFAMIKADVYVASILVLAGFLLTDICYAIADPRIRLE